MSEEKLYRIKTKKANIIDNYGDKWEASFDGKCTVNGEKGRAHNMNYGEPKKQ